MGRDVFVSGYIYGKLFDKLQKYVIVHTHNKTAIMVAELATPIAFHWNESIYARSRSQDAYFDVRVFNPNA